MIPREEPMLNLLSAIRKARNAMRFLADFFRAGLEGYSWREKRDFLARCWRTRGLILKAAFSPQKHTCSRCWELSRDPRLADRVCSFLARAAWILPKPYGSKLTLGLYLDRKGILCANFGMDEIDPLKARVRELVEKVQRERAAEGRELAIFVTSVAALLLDLPERELPWEREDWERARWERMGGLRYLAGVFLWGWWECGWRKEGWKGRARFVVRFLRAIPWLLGAGGLECVRRRVYTARWEKVNDGKEFAAQAEEFLSRAFVTAGKPGGDGRFLVWLFVDQGSAGYNLVDVGEAELEEAVKFEMTGELGPWKGRDFEVALVPLGAVRCGLDLPPLKGNVALGHFSALQIVVECVRLGVIMEGGGAPYRQVWGMGSPA